MTNQRLQKQIGENIKQLRLSKNLGQGKVAKSLSISVAALSKIENGLTDINLSRLAQIAQLFEVSIFELISKEISMAPANVLAEIEKLRDTITLRDAEISKLQKKVIDLYEKLGI
jgi:transcriptional regulator with XRE-family HTH domain